MKLFAVVLAAAVSFALFAPASSASVRECRTSDGNGWSTRDVKQAISCATSRWYVRGGARKAKSVARCESGFRPRARNGSVGGVFQHQFRYWDGRFRRFRVPGWGMHSSIWNARSNVVVSIRMAHAQGWKAWSCA